MASKWNIFKTKSERNVKETSKNTRTVTKQEQFQRTQSHLNLKESMFGFSSPTKKSGRSTSKPSSKGTTTPKLPSKKKPSSPSKKKKIVAVECASVPTTRKNASKILTKLKEKKDPELALIQNVTLLANTGLVLLKCILRDLDKCLATDPQQHDGKVIFHLDEIQIGQTWLTLNGNRLTRSSINQATFSSGMHLKDRIRHHIEVSTRPVFTILYLPDQVSNRIFSLLLSDRSATPAVDATMMDFLQFSGNSKLTNDHELEKLAEECLSLGDDDDDYSIELKQNAFNVSKDLLICRSVCRHWRALIDKEFLGYQLLDDIRKELNLLTASPTSIHSRNSKWKRLLVEKEQETMEEELEEIVSMEESFENEKEENEIELKIIEQELMEEYEEKLKTSLVEKHKEKERRLREMMAKYEPHLNSTV